MTLQQCKASLIRAELKPRVPSNGRAVILLRRPIGGSAAAGCRVTCTCKPAEQKSPVELNNETSVRKSMVNKLKCLVHFCKTKATKMPRIRQYLSNRK
jgi:hypothetical protein